MHVHVCVYIYICSGLSRDWTDSGIGQLLRGPRSESHNACPSWDDLFSRSAVFDMMRRACLSWLCVLYIIICA